MPPRVVKRGAAAGGSKRAGRGGRVVGKQQNSLREEAVKVEDVQIDDKPVVEEKPLIEEKPVVVEEKPVVLANEPVDSGPVGGAGSRSDMKSAVAVRKEEEVKESGDEYEKDERLELDDNEPEEYAGDYDDKEMEQENVQEEGEESEEEAEEEENIGEEEDDDMVEEEIIEEVAEEIECEEEPGHASEEPGHASEEPEHAEVYVEEEDHHDVIKERRKRKEFEVFVGGLDKDANEDDIRRVFSQVGEITEVRLMMNPLTKKNKGFAFLRFASIEQAKRAVTELKHPMINGKQCGVTPSQDSDTLFLGNICKTWTKEALKEKLKHYGVDNVDDMTLVEDSNNEGMNRGFAFLEFSSRSDAMDAFKRLQKRDVLFGIDRPAKVSFADSFIDPGDEIMAQVKTVFIDGLPASWDEDCLRELLKKYGEVEKVELARNMPSAKRKDFGFVTFDSHDAAVTCAKSINNTELGEGDSKAKVRARLSRPLQRGKGKHVSRGDFPYLHGAGRVVRGPYGRPTPRSLSGGGMRGIGRRLSALSPVSMKRPIVMRDRHPPVMSMPARGRPLPPPRSYERRAHAPSYPKSSFKRNYGRRDELPPPRSRVAIDYGSRAAVEMRPSSYRDEYSRSSDYSDIPRSTSRSMARRAYVDDGYSQRFERLPPSYREGRAREYDPISGSKRSYSAMDDVPHRYSNSSFRHSRARMDYELGGSASQYGDAYGDRLGRSNMGYGSSRGSMSSQDSHGVYSSRQGMNYGGGSYGGDSGMYSSSYGGDYMSRQSRGHDAGGSSYSSLYSGRGVSGSSYMGSGGSGSYY